jgi:internalin A
MKTQKTVWHSLSILALLATGGLGVCADGSPDPLPAEVVKAWSDAGAEVNWMMDIPPRKYGFWNPWREKGETSAIPAFRFPENKNNDLTNLPDPGTAFGLDFHCGFSKPVTLKELAALKNLRSLNLGAALRFEDPDFKILAGHKNLQALYLFHTQFNDIGLMQLEGLKDLQVLDLYSTRVTDSGVKELSGFKKLHALNLGMNQITDAGLKELAALKNLRWLNVRGTKVTAAGVDTLLKELPECKITGPKSK